MSNSTSEKTTNCDVETIITAEITLIERDVELHDDFPLEEYKKYIRGAISKFIPGDRLKDDSINVQIFLHEKREKTSKNE